MSAIIINKSGEKYGSVHDSQIFYEIPYLSVRFIKEGIIMTFRTKPSALNDLTVGFVVFCMNNVIT